MKNKKTVANNSIHQIQRKIFSTQLILIILLAVVLGGTGILINVHFETQKRDRNLQNISQTIAASPLLDEMTNETNSEYLTEYFDSLQRSLGDVDVISIVSGDNIRLYHSNHALIGTVYDGTLPTFENNEFYAEDNDGPSGKQRRAYAPIYDTSGEYVGFVITVMLQESIKKETLQTMLVFFLITAVAVLMEVIISAELSGNIKKKLHGYEPDVFSAMYQVRDNILESLAEGVIAIDKATTVQFINGSAIKMLGCQRLSSENIVGHPLQNICDPTVFENVLSIGEKEFGAHEAKLKNNNLIIDRIPIKKDGKIIGAVGILHNREEYIKLMEDLAGTRYLVDSMRANNHDFTNKLHVILGLLQMEMYGEAASYIENITIVQREMIGKIMSTVSEPAIAALLIGKIARGSELNIKFVLQEGSVFDKNDQMIPTETLITVMGNLIDNAFEAMNTSNGDFERQNQLLFGIYSKPDELIVTVKDTGVGIKHEDMKKVFENGYSTKGKGRGTGLYQVKHMVENLGGEIALESQVGIGTVISVSFRR